MEFRIEIFTVSRANKSTFTIFFFFLPYISYIGNSVDPVNWTKYKNDIKTEKKKKKIQNPLKKIIGRADKQYFIQFIHKILIKL